MNDAASSYGATNGAGNRPPDCQKKIQSGLEQGKGGSSERLCCSPGTVTMTTVLASSSSSAVTMTTVLTRGVLATVVGHPCHSVAGIPRQGCAGAYRCPDHFTGQDQLHATIQLTTDRGVVRRHGVPLSESTRGERAG